MAKVVWKGSNYYRRRHGSWRNRNTGNVVVIDPKKINIIKRNKNKLAVLTPSATKFIGNEKTNEHFFGGRDNDPTRKKGNSQVFMANNKFRYQRLTTTVKPNRPTAKKRRSGHTRKLK